MASTKENTSSMKAIREISWDLVKNHLHASLEPSEWNELVENNVLDDPVERRVVAVVGSGASQTAGLPLTREALQILKEESTVPSKALEAELDRLSQIYKLEKDAFETHLRALSISAFEAQKLRDNLQKLYSHRFMPVLGYEILAHMLKHRFLDAIINFNFDELLDQSIEDELDRREYRHILSDGDCPDESELRNRISELPFYIKPHGTARHKSTLRFTREDYYGLPFDIQRVLKYLLTDKPVVLLVIGFGMQSLEFNHILEEAKEGSKIFHINFSNPTSKNAFRRFGRNELLKVDSPNSGKREKNTISEMLTSIWDCTAASLKEEYRPRNISRHILVSKIFSGNVKENNKESYLRGRTVIEICLSIAKAKGLITMSQLTDDRCGKYFDYYKPYNREANFYEMCRQIGLKDIGYSREAMRLMKEQPETMNPNILSVEEFEKEIDFLYSRVQDNLDPVSRNRLSKNLFRETLLEMYHGPEIELRYQPHSPYTKIFRYPKPIPTYTVMKFYTKQMFYREWSYLFAVAETGQWLMESYFSEQIMKNENAKIYLIVADTIWEEEIRKTFGKRIVDVKRLPWWEHNRHITIMANQNRTPLSGIYFSRRLRSANINPVLLDNVDDTLSLLESFNAYWIKASRMKEEWISAAESGNFGSLFD